MKVSVVMGGDSSERDVSIMTGEGRINGKAIKIDNDGALIISKGKIVQRILVGDIIH